MLTSLLAVVALVFAVIEVVKTRGQSLGWWAVLILALLMAQPLSPLL